MTALQKNFSKHTHKKMSRKHFFCTWGCQKEARGNPQDHSGTQNIPDDVSMIGLKPPEHKLEKIPKIGAVGTSKSTKGCVKV